MKKLALSLFLLCAIPPLHQKPCTALNTPSIKASASLGSFFKTLGKKKHAHPKLRFGAYIIDLVIGEIIIEIFFRLNLRKLLPKQLYHSWYKGIALGGLTIIRFGSFSILHVLTETFSIAIGGVSKRLLGIKVVDKDGRDPTIGQTLLRSFFKLHPALTLISSIFILFTQDHQALHDIIAKTYVVEIDK